MAPSSGSGTGTPVSSLQVSLEGLPYLSAVWRYNSGAGTYTNNTVESRTSAGTAFSLFANSSDYTYFGSQSRFDLLVFLLSGVGALSGIVWHYWDGSTWTQFIPSHDFDFTSDGAEQFEQLPNWTARSLSNTDPHAATVPDTTNRYWIRISATTVSTAPTVNQIKMRPYAAYCTASDVRQLLSLKNDFSSTTVPTRNTIEDYIHAAQSYIDFMTYKSWRPSFKKEELYQFNIAGIKLIQQNVQSVTKLEIWNGSTFETKTQGRQNDYFIDPTTGLLFFARYFLLPARLQSFNAPMWLWGWAEYNFPVRISYIYGRDRVSDSQQGMMVWDIARKLAAIDVIQNHDYSILAVSGADKVALSEKIAMWKQEIDTKLESMRAWVIF